MMKKLWNDDAGVVTIEYLVLGTFLALALIVGVTTLAAGINSELGELGQAVGSFSQNYTASGFQGCGAVKEGSQASGDDGTVQDITRAGVQNTNIEDPACAP